MTPPVRRRGLAMAIALLSALPFLAAHPPTFARPATEVCEIRGDTTWSVAGSPYRSTCSLTVPAGVTLTIEPGVAVQLGSFHNLTVAGRLLAIGNADQPILFEPLPEGATWGGVQLAATSGPSEIAFARFVGGGGGRREMLGIATDRAVVRECDFGRSAGVAMEIRNAAPTVRDSRFIFASDSSATPPAALRILGISEPILAGNYFQSNNLFGISMEMNASPRFSGNRFLYNGFDGVLVYGNLTRDVRWPNLGNRGWSYHASRSQLTIERGARLTIDAGATLKFAAGLGLRVSGTLAIRGAAAAPVYIGTNVNVPKPGSWREIWFLPESTAYDPETGEGSLIDHAILEHGSSQPNGQVWIQGSSPRIANTIIRYSGQRGVVVSGGPAARPELVNVTFADNIAEPNGAGLVASEGTQPTVAWSTFVRNRVGVRSESGAQPQVGPHNHFSGNLTYAVYNDDFDVCVNAADNDWGAPSGPRDTSDRFDACDQGRNDGTGSLVSDHVRYREWEGTLAPTPVILSPQCGLYRSARPTLSGYAPPGSTVSIYDHQQLLGTATAGEGQDEGPWSFTPAEPLAAGSHLFRAQATRDRLVSGISSPLPLLVDPLQPIQPDGIAVTYDLDGVHYVQPYQDAAGCLTLLGDGSWPIRPLSGAPITLHVPVSCPGGAAPSGVVHYGNQDHPMRMDAADRLSVTLEQGQGGPLSLQVMCEGVKRDLLLGTVSPEYDGFVYDLAGGVLARVAGAKVTLYRRDRSSEQWLPWDGAAYHGQMNPAITGGAGRFAFYPQPGLYRALIEAAGYPAQFGPQVEVTVNPYVANIGLGMEGGPTGASVYLPVAHH